METTKHPDPFAAAEHVLAEAGIDFTVVDICSEACSVCADSPTLTKAA